MKNLLIEGRTYLFVCFFLDKLKNFILEGGGMRGLPLIGNFGSLTFVQLVVMLT
jgi:hypothetical protein